MVATRKKSPKVLSKRKNVGVKQTNNDGSFKVRQTTLQESFKAAEKKLRPRTRKNYCEISRRSQNLTDSDDAVQKSDKPDAVPKTGKANKGIPIYKTVQILPDSPKTDKVYEFDASSDDTEPRKKKKRKVTKKAPVKRVKYNPVPAVPKKKVEITKTPVVVLTRTKIPKKVQKTPQKEPQKVPAKKHVEFNFDACDMEIPNIENCQNICNAPKITKMEKLNGSRKFSLTATTPVSKAAAAEFRTLRDTNVFTSKQLMQYHNMINHSLLNKSLSPIKKVGSDFDVGSPWRPHLPQCFSRIKNLVQSTPKVQFPVNRGKGSALTSRMALGNKIPVQNEKTINLDSTCEENVPISPVKSPRQFGVEISNTSCPKSVKLAPNVSLRVGQTAESAKPVAKVPLTNFAGNEENTPPPQSPVKSQKKSKFSAPSPFRLERSRTNKKHAKPSMSQQKENTEPQAGSSFLENFSPPTPNLKQSNLNEFLNLDDMPQSTVITTNHGIFNDVHSTPFTYRKQAKKTEIGIENAFGFDDDCLSDEDSPVNRITPPNKINKKSKLTANPSRISVRGIKRNLIQNVLKPRNAKPLIPVVNKIVEKPENEEYRNEPEEESFVDPAEFADTFDVLSESGQLVHMAPSEVPLFQDLEPAHFSKPARHSYKRKRPVRFNLSEPEYAESCSEEEEEIEKKKKKRRINTKENKRMQEWVKNINATFDEIDEHELVIE